VATQGPHGARARAALRREIRTADVWVVSGFADDELGRSPTASIEVSGQGIAAQTTRPGQPGPAEQIAAAFRQILSQSLVGLPVALVIAGGATVWFFLRAGDAELVLAGVGVVVVGAIAAGVAAVLRPAIARWGADGARAVVQAKRIQWDQVRPCAASDEVVRLEYEVGGARRAMSFRCSAPRAIALQARVDSMLQRGREQAAGGAGADRVGSEMEAGSPDE